eukprot:comp19135_c0_seq1/m.21784 comp19135_c0_seq1/g.21784  ORF comp19135_c0_seq1/g.21784 comp19135_c0_seq1/m.21784 type:complete len:441 (-) comp19135_c0_seq1:504-1826(-)
MGPVATFLLLGVIAAVSYKASFLSMKAFRRLKPGNLINILFFYLIIFTASGNQNETGPTSPSSNWPTLRRARARSLRHVATRPLQKDEKGEEKGKGLVDTAPTGKGKEKNRGSASGGSKTGRSTMKKKQKELDSITEQSLSEKKKEKGGGIGMGMGILPGSLRRTRKEKEGMSSVESVPTDSDLDLNRGGRGDRGDLPAAAAGERTRNQTKHLSIGAGMYSFVTSPRDLWRKRDNKKGEPMESPSNSATDVPTIALIGPSTSTLPACLRNSTQASALGSNPVDLLSDQMVSDTRSVNSDIRSVDTNGSGGVDVLEIQKSGLENDNRHIRVSFAQPDRTPGKITPERQRTKSLLVGRRPFSDGGIPNSGPFPPVSSQAPEDSMVRLPNSGANGLFGAQGRVRRAATEGALKSKEDRRRIFPEEGGFIQKTPLQRFLSRAVE